jgi:transposase-like protein
MRGPAPEFQPVFSRQERQQVQELLRRRNAPYSQIRRAKLAELLAARPDISSPEAARLLGVHEQFVRKWRRRWAKKGFGLEDLPRSGRPRVFSPEGHHGRQKHRL